MKKLHVGGCIPLPISLTGMLTHGREPGAYCHLSVTGLWPGDPNFTVCSLARCLRDLEQMDDTGDHIGDLARTTSAVNFLMVGHTHEDVDALFSKVSAQTINKDVLTLPALMAEIWDNETMHPVPLLLEEVADYKSYVDSCLRFTLAQRQQEATRDGPENGIIVVDELQQELHQENNLMLQPYVGDPANRPKRSFIPLEDITEGKFVILRPHDAFEAEIPRMIWLGRAMGAVVQEIDDEHHGQFLVEWWSPKHRKSNATNKERYLNVLAGQKDWEKDPGYFTPEWINATAAVYSWKYKSKEGVPQNARLNPLAKTAIESHFQQLDKKNEDL
ncbi:hypothetical protein R1sor_000724 [Riccia sorocarpa]|uniref:DUF7869 domain-containing protein n=1 Tax=Riccia sorocarpa TaxID=122646 RepID=A0ABD3GX07_9MARC